MARYLLLTHYRGGRAGGTTADLSPMSEWTPEEVEAHMAYMQHVADTLAERGEFVDGQALKPEGTFVRADGAGRPPVTDGPSPRDQGPHRAGLRAPADVPDDVPRRVAVEAHLRELAGEVPAARVLYARAADAASNRAEGDHLLGQAARLGARQVPQE